MTITTERLEETKEQKDFHALLRHMREVARAKPQTPKEISALDFKIWQYAGQKTVTALINHIDSLESQLLAAREAVPVAGEGGASLQLRSLIRQRHAKCSEETFGSVGPVGPLKHLSKEALEAAAEPDDLSEWADIQFLMWDAQRRAGISDAEITAAMEEKLKVNMARQWPEPKDGEPRLHITAPPAPAVPEVKIQKAILWLDGFIKSHPGMKEPVTCRAVILGNCATNEASAGAGLAAETSENCATVIPPGYKMVPVIPTFEMVQAARKYHGGDNYLPASLYRMMLSAAPEVKGD